MVVNGEKSCIQGLRQLFPRALGAPGIHKRADAAHEYGLWDYSRFWMVHLRRSRLAPAKLFILFLPEAEGRGRAGRGLASCVRPGSVPP